MKPPCSQPDCGRPSLARGLCGKHYGRWRANGDASIALKKMPPKGAIAEWVSEHLEYDGDDCLKWPFSDNGAGYGMITINGRRQLATRFFCEKRRGPPPSLSHEAAHLCGKGHEGCINPKHLIWKTPAENQQDRAQHGTMLFGERSPVAKLTGDQVAAIRAAIGVRQKDLAAQYGVTQTAISKIRLGKMWKAA